VGVDFLENKGVGKLQSGDSNVGNTEEVDPNMEEVDIFKFPLWRQNGRAKTSQSRGQ